MHRESRHYLGQMGPTFILFDRNTVVTLMRFQDEHSIFLRFNKKKLKITKQRVRHFCGGNEIELFIE